MLNSTFKAFEVMKQEDEDKIKPLYRNRSWNREERSKLKEKKKQNWWKSGSKTDFKSVFFVPPTPGGVLAKDLTKREAEVNKNNKDRYKIVETGGIKAKDILTTKNPYPKKECTQKACPICSGNNFQNIQCSTNNIGYRWICDTCKHRNIDKIYEGETSRSGRIRSKEHIAAMRNKKCDSVLYKHKLLEHKYENVQYKFEITQKFKDALTRQANEAVRINSRNNSELLNSKSEFNHPPVARVIVEKSKKIFKKPGLVNTAPACSIVEN